MDIITGNPGTGKTLLAVKTIVDKYFFWHNKDRCFYRKEDAKKYTIITNIDGFSLNTFSLDELLKETPFNTFFSKEYQDVFHQQHPHIIYVIDECQQYIDKYFRNSGVIFYFDYHRHYGDIIYLVTQDITKICKDISVLHDYEYRAVNRTFSLAGEFRYNIKSKGERVKGQSFRNPKKYFDLYTSFIGDNKESRRNPVLFILLGLISLFLLVGYFFYKGISPVSSPPPASSPPAAADPPPVSSPPPAAADPSPVYKMSDVEPPIDQIYSVKIDGWCERDNKLFMFVDPITNSPVSPGESLYPVKKFGESYYALLTLVQYAEMTKVADYTDQVNTPNVYTHHDKVTFPKPVSPSATPHTDKIRAFF